MLEPGTSEPANRARERRYNLFYALLCGERL